MAALVEIVAYRRLRAAQHRMISMITALGAAYVIQNLSELKWGKPGVAFSIPVPGQTGHDHGGHAISLTHLVTLAIAVAVIAVFNVFLKRHKMGKAILCVSEDIPTSSLMGIPDQPDHVHHIFSGRGLRGDRRGALFIVLRRGFPGHGLQGHGGGFHRRGHRRHRQPGAGAMIGGMILGISEKYHQRLRIQHLQGPDHFSHPHLHSADQAHRYHGQGRAGKGLGGEHVRRRRQGGTRRRGLSGEA